MPERSIMNMSLLSTCRFFQLMGKVFGFVSSDVKQKVEILEVFRQSKDKSQEFTSFKTMMEYEKSDNLLDKKDYVSGSRTLLRLHRGLGEPRKNAISGVLSYRQPHTTR